MHDVNEIENAVNTSMLLSICGLLRFLTWESTRHTSRPTFIASIRDCPSHVHQLRSQLRPRANQRSAHVLQHPLSLFIWQSSELSLTHHLIPCSPDSSRDIFVSPSTSGRFCDHIDHAHQQARDWRVVRQSPISTSSTGDAGKVGLVVSRGRGRGLEGIEGVERLGGDLRGKIREKSSRFRGEDMPADVDRDVEILVERVARGLDRC